MMQSVIMKNECVVSSPTMLVTYSGPSDYLEMHFLGNGYDRVYTVYHTFLLAW